MIQNAFFTGSRAATPEVGRRAWPAYVLLLLAVVAVPVYWLLSLELYPFNDVPNHLAAATIIKYIDDPAVPFREFVDVALSPFRPNIAHVTFCSWFDSVEAGNRVWHVLYVVLLCGALFLIFRLGNANYRLLPLLVTVVFNFNVLWGFVGFTMAIALFFMLMALEIWFLQKPSVRRGIPVAALLVLIYYCHVQVALFSIAFVVLANVWLIATSPQKRWLLGVAPVFPVTLLFLLWIGFSPEFTGDSTLKFLLSYYPSEFAGSVPGRLTLFYKNDITALSSDNGMVRVLGFCFSILPVVGLTVALRPSTWGLLRRDVLLRSVMLFTAMSLACYLLLPVTVPGQWFVFERFTWLLMVGGLLLLPRLKTLQVRPALGWLSVIPAIGYVVLWSGYFSGFRDFSKDFDRSLFPPEDDAPLMASIIVNPQFRGSTPLVHYGNYRIVWARQMAVTKLVDYRFYASIRRKPGGREIPEFFEWIESDTNLDSLVEQYGVSPSLLTYLWPPARDHALRSRGYATVRRSGNWAVWQRKE